MDLYKKLLKREQNIKEYLIKLGDFDKKIIKSKENIKTNIIKSDYFPKRKINKERLLFITVEIE